MRNDAPRKVNIKIVTEVGTSSFSSMLENTFSTKYLEIWVLLNMESNFIIADFNRGKSDTNVWTMIRLIVTVFHRNFYTVMICIYPLITGHGNCTARVAVDVMLRGRAVTMTTTPPPIAPAPERPVLLVTCTHSNTAQPFSFPPFL